MTFGYTGTMVPYVIPETGTYQIIADGAQGGDNPRDLGASPSVQGGLGAEIGGDIALQADFHLEIAVGEMGVSGEVSRRRWRRRQFCRDRRWFPPACRSGWGGGAGPGAKTQNNGQTGYDGLTGTGGGDGFGTIIHRGVGGC